MGMERVLEVQSLRSGYGPKEVLHGVSLHVGSGEIVALLGPNGAGKSTVLKTVMGFLRPWGGLIAYRGERINGREPHKLVRLGISYVPQGRILFPYMTVQEHLRLGAWTLPKGKFPEALDQAYTLFPRLAERRHQKARTLSGGERQMLALAQALMIQPQLLFLDEPSLGLAPKLVDLVFEKITEINEKLGISILMVEQNAAKALEYSNRGYVLEMGRNRFEGPSERLLHDEEVRRLYLGGGRRIDRGQGGDRGEQRSRG